MLLAIIATYFSLFFTMNNFHSLIMFKLRYARYLRAFYNIKLKKKNKEYLDRHVKNVIKEKKKKWKAMLVRVEREK